VGLRSHHGELKLHLVLWRQTVRTDVCLLLRVHEHDNFLVDVVHICGVICLDLLLLMVGHRWDGTHRWSAKTVFFFILLFNSKTLDDL
jgi:hypothetical protein